MNHTTKTTIHTAAKWSSLTELLAKLITPVINMILARLLLPDAFGAAAAITMVISFAELFTDAGFQKYLIQHEFPDSRSLEDSTDAAFWSNLTVSAVLTFVIFLFRHPIARLIGNPGLGNAVGVSSLLILIAAFSGIPTARFRRSMDFRTLFYVRLGTALLPLPVTVPAAFVLRDYRALLIGTFGSQLFSAVFLTVRSGWKPSFRFSFAQLKEMLSFSVWTMLESISVWMTSYAGVFLVANELNAHYLGLYKTSMATVNGFMAIITGAVTP
ncbi:MAG: oligosaccharide flippase family protein, partial [Clostridia bacterium]|nr:oligosaccharide flippase family protein [Clostridia bacterium]